MGTTFTHPPSTSRIPSCSIGGKTPGIAQEADTAGRRRPPVKKTGRAEPRSRAVTPTGIDRSSKRMSSTSEWTPERKSSIGIMEIFVAPKP